MRLRTLWTRAAFSSFNLLGILLAIGITTFFLDATIHALSPSIHLADLNDLKGKQPSIVEFGERLFPEHSLGVFRFLLGLLALTGIGSCLVAVALFMRATDTPAVRQFAWLLLAYAVFVALWYFFEVLPRYRDIFASAKNIFDTLGLCVIGYVATALARFLIIFPRPVDVESVHRSFFQRYYRFAARTPTESSAKHLGLNLRLFRNPESKSYFLKPWHHYLLSGRMLWLVAALFVAANLGPAWTHWTGWAGWIWRTLIFFMFGAIAFYAFLGLPYAFASTTHLFHFGTADERRKVGWLRGALFWFGVLTALAFSIVVIQIFIGELFRIKLFGNSGRPIGALIMLYWMFLPTFAVVSVAFAVLYGGALDPRVAITKLTIWSLLGIGVTLIFVFIERLVALKVVQHFELPADTGAVAAGAIIAGSFVPLRNITSKYITRLAERWIPLKMVADGERVIKVVGIADLSGYTALSAADEPAAMLQSAALKRLAEKIADAHDGKLVKSLGDAVLLTFKDASSGLRAMRELHVALPKAIESLGLKPLQLHSALHLGEIVETHDGDIFGQTVNITSRLADTAAAGEIVVSEPVYSVAKADFALKELGLRKFKNVPEAVRCYQVIG